MAQQKNNFSSPVELNKSDGKENNHFLSSWFPFFVISSVLRMCLEVSLLKKWVVRLRQTFWAMSKRNVFSNNRCAEAREELFASCWWILLKSKTKLMMAFSFVSGYHESMIVPVVVQLFPEFSLSLSWSMKSDSFEEKKETEFQVEQGLKF